MAIKRIEALGLGDVLGSLLGSVVDAQAQSARASVDFIEDVGFETTAEGERLRTVKLKYSKRDENDEPADFEVEVPLLALVNVPSLAVKEAKLSFSYDVVTAQAGEKKSTVNARPTLADKFSAKHGVRPAKLTGFVKRKTSVGGSNTFEEKRTTAIDLDVTLEQQEVPIGIERLFDLAELGITEKKVED